LAAPALSADPPRYVAGPASVLQYECRQARPAMAIGAAMSG